MGRNDGDDDVFFSVERIAHTKIGYSIMFLRLALTDEKLIQFYVAHHSVGLNYFTE